MDQKLAQMQCSASRGDEPALADHELKHYLSEVPKWDVVEEDGVKKLKRTFTFSNFTQALDFTNTVGETAEEEGHHPIITLTWGKATVIWFSHEIKGLHENDFIMAAKTDELYADD
jgi:4a-hydroxytetrahydrobiopterin dehydratase